MRPGERLFSSVCDTSVVVVRPGQGVDVITCGGAPMTAESAEPTGKPATGFDEGTLLGKRYVDEISGVELLCTKGGGGSLAVDGRVLTVKQAKPLPASD
jgi:hypothetical protein